MRISINSAERFLFVIMLFFLYIYNFQTGGFGNTATNALIIGFIGFEILQIIKKKGIVIVTPEITSLLLFVVVCAISVIYSTAQNDSISKVQTLLIMLIFFIALTYFISREGNLELLLRTISICGVMAALYCLVNSSWLSGIRVNRIIGDTNQVSAYLAYSMTILLYCGKKDLLPRILVYPGAGVIVFANIIGGSRSGLIVAILGLAGFMLATIERDRFRIVKIFGFIVIVAVGLVFLVRLIMNNPILYNIIGRRYVSFFEIMSGKGSSIGETSTDERNLLRQLAWARFVRNPATIVGGNGIAYFNSYYQSIGGGYYFCHNNYLELLSGIGIFGAAFFYMPYIRTEIKGVRAYFRNRSIESAAVLVVLAQVLIMHWFVVFYYQKLEFVVLAAMIALVSSRGDRAVKEVLME